MLGCLGMGGGIGRGSEHKLGIREVWRYVRLEIGSRGRGIFHSWFDWGLADADT